MTRPDVDDWRARARCTPEVAYLFDEFTKADRSRGGDVGVERIAQAVAICNTCTARSECLTDAIESLGSGVRGGVYLEGGQIHHVVTDRADRRASIRGEVAAR